MTITEGAEIVESATRKVRMSPELMAGWATRDAFGRLLTWDWGEPDEYGFYTPTVTTVDDAKRLVDVETLARALHLAGVRCSPNMPYCRASHVGHARRIWRVLP